MDREVVSAFSFIVYRRVIFSENRFPLFRITLYFVSGQNSAISGTPIERTRIESGRPSRQ